MGDGSDKLVTVDANPKSKGFGKVVHSGTFSPLVRRELMPLIEGFGQDVRMAVDRSSGRVRRELSHVLKVFLIDRAGDVREIYSSTFLHPQTVLNDIETLIIEEGKHGGSEIRRT